MREVGKYLTDDEVDDFITKAEDLRTHGGMTYSEICRMIGYTAQASLTHIRRRRVDGRGHESRPSRTKYERLVRLHATRLGKREQVPTLTPRSRFAAFIEDRRTTLAQEREAIEHMMANGAPALVKPGLQELANRIDEALALVS